MRTFKLNKLVRDKIVAFHQDMGGSADYKVLDDAGYLEALCQKLAEEASEIDSTNTQELLKELADLQEVIDCTLAAIGKSKQDLHDAQGQKNAKSGSFKKRHYIKTVTLPDNSEWATYYAKDPKRFPEVK